MAGKNEKEEKVQILKKGSVITVITIVSRLLGYLREAIQAYIFGATFLVDAFVVAFNFPELIQTLFFSGVGSAILVPVCTKYLKDETEYSHVYSTFLNILFLATSAFAILVFFLSEWVVEIIAPGFSFYAKVVTRNLFIIMIPVIIMHGALSVMKSFLNAKEHFAGPELSGILWNVVFILSCVFLKESLGIYSLAVGVTLGSLLQVLLQYPFLKRHRINYVARINLNHESISEAKRLFFGAFVGASIVPINSFVDRILASFLPEGHVASLSYAFRIFVLPFSLFAVPVYTVSFSALSTLYHQKNWQKIFSYLDNSIILLSFTLIPSSALVCGLKTEIVKLLYERGAFGSTETYLTSYALLGYGVGLFFYGLSVLFVRTFNAIHDTKTPAKLGLISIFLNFVFDVILMIPYKNFGIAFATSLVSFLNVVCLFLLWKKKTGYRIGKELPFAFYKSVFSAFLILLSTHATRNFFTNAFLLILLNLIIGFFIVFLFFRDIFWALLRSRR